MATDIVQKPPELRPLVEWRETLRVRGVVVLPDAARAAGDDVSWQALGADIPVSLTEICAHTGEFLMYHGQFPSWVALRAVIVRLVALTPGAFDPAHNGPFRLVVREWP